MQVAPSAAAYAPGDLASQPAPGSTPGSTDQPQDNASTALFAPTDNAPSTTLALMVQAPTKPLLLTPESAAGLGIDLVQTKPLVVTPENGAGLNLPLPADNTAPAAAPSASPTEIAALELLLAEPANQDIIAQFGPPLRALNTDTDVGQGILARFGPDLGARLTQLQEAHNAVRGQFLQALDQAQQNPGPDVAGSELIARRSSGGDAEHITEQTLYSVTHPPSASQASDLQAIEAQALTAGGQPQNLWRLSDPAEFAKAYANGDSPAQKAFAQLHGKEPLQFHAAVQHGETDAGPDITPAYYGLGESQLVLGGPTVTENGNPGPWAASTWQATQLTPEQNRDLINKEYLWFDPVNGWSTDLANNIRQSSNFLDKALPMVFAGIMTFATAGAFGITAASASTSLGQTMALGAISSATLQLTTGGKIDLGELLRSALTAGVSFGVMNATGMNELLQGGDLATRSLGHLGKAGLQGLLQEATGGKFKDGLTNSLLASVAGEVGKSLEGQIAELSKNEGLSVQEVSMLRLIGRAASSAVRVAGSNDPAAGFASDFLGGVLGDGLRGAQEQSQSQNSSQAEQQGDRPSSDWVTNLGPSEVDAQGLGLRPGLGGLGVRVSDEALSGWSDEIDGGIVLNGSMAPDAQAVTEAVVGTGQGPLAALAAAGLDAQQQRAAYGQVLASGQIQLNAQGVPIVQPGQVLRFDLSDTSAAQWGGRAIEHESAGRIARDLAEQRQHLDRNDAQLQQDVAQQFASGVDSARWAAKPLAEQIPTGPARYTVPPDPSQTEGLAGQLLDHLDRFNNSPIGMALQGLPPEGLAIGGIRAGLTWLGKTDKVVDSLQVENSLASSFDNVEKTVGSIGFGSLRSPSELMGVEPASKELLAAVGAKRSLIIARPGSEELRMLDYFGAEASVGGVKNSSILLRENPSKAALLEEFLHGTQARLGIVDRLGNSGLGSAETHVKDFMMRHRQMLGLSDEDVRILKILRDKGL